MFVHGGHDADVCRSPQFPPGNRAGARDRLYLGCVDFPEALKERRAALRLSQLDLALKAGTTQRHLSFIESGRSVPGRDVVIRLDDLFQGVMGLRVGRGCPGLLCDEQHGHPRDRTLRED
jgi:DNA-binding XRE family transcriptional regulator